MTNSETYPQSYWDALLAKMDRITAGNGTAAEIEEIKEQFKITNYTPVGSPVTTSGAGSTQWIGLSEHKLYAWKEVGAPEGYTGSEEYHYFVAYQYLDVNTEDPFQTKLLSEEEQTNRKHAAWALDDATQLANGIRVASMANLTTWTATNVESKYTSISATKVWENDSDNLFETRPEGGIKLQLVRINADGTTDPIGEKISINVDDDGNWPTYIWNKLPAQDNGGNALKYTVVEDKVENYSTTYSDGGEGKTSGEITVTNRMIPKSTNIHVKKIFEVDEGDEMPSEIKVSLMVIKTDRDGVVGEPEETSYETRLSASNDWSWTFEALPTSDTEGNTLSYTAVEDTAALERQGFHYTVSYSDDGTGVVEAPEDDPLVITNSKVKGSVKVTKTFSGMKNLPEDFQITATYTDADGTEKTVVLTTSSEGMTGTGSSDNPYTWIIDDLPLGTEVTFTETGITADGYVVTANGTARAESCSEKAKAVENLAEDEEGQGTAAFVNEYVEDKGSLKIEKDVKYNGGEASGDDQKEKVNKTFSFTIKDLNGDPAKGKVNGTDIPENGNVSVSVTDGKSGSILITDMQPGKYTITENADTTGLTLISITGGNNDPNLERRSITVEVKGGDAEAAQATAQVVFTNNYETTESTVIKNWDNKGKDIPTSIEMTLLVNGEDSDPKITRTLNAGNNWTATITGLDKYLDGKEIVYSWREGGVPHYTVSSMTEDGTTVTFTNSYMTYDLKTSYVGKKSWVDQSNKFKTRPENLKVILKRKIASDNDWTSLELVPTWTNTETDEWTYTFSDIPVFDDNGNVYNYQAIEESPSGYIGSISNQMDTNYSIGSITYEDGHNRVTTDNKVIWTLSTTTDLAFVVIAPTAHGNCTVWSHRLPTPGEKAEIERILRGGALPPATGRPIDYYSGTGSNIYTPHGNISVDFDEETGTVTMDFGKTKVWSQFIVGQFNTTAEQKYNPGSTSFTNELETTKLEGSKTWVIDGTTVPANPILTLTRTVTTTGDGAESTTSTPEVVKVMEGGTEVNLQPTWSGTGKTRTFEYTGLPKKDKDGNVYSYSVSEYKFTVGDVTYTVSKSDQGYVATPDPDHADTASKFQVSQSDNAIFNTELKDFEVIKIWKDASDNNTGWIKNIKVFLHSKSESGDETTYEYEISQAADGSFNADSRTAGAPAASVSGNEKDGYTIKWSDLPAGNTYSATEEKVSGYKDPEYAKKVADGENGQLSTKDESGKDYTKAEDGMYIINRPEDAVSLPSTGGPGTRMFTVLGITLLAFAGVLLAQRRRRTI